MLVKAVDLRTKIEGRESSFLYHIVRKAERQRERDPIFLLLLVSTFSHLIHSEELTRSNLGDQAPAPNCSTLLLLRRDTVEFPEQKL